MYLRYFYYLCNVRVSKFRVQNRVRLVLSLFSKVCKLHGKSIAITIKLHCFCIIKQWSLYKICIDCGAGGK